MTPDPVRSRARGSLEAIEYRLAKVRTRHPEKFSDKLRYKLLRDHRPLLTTFADKVAVREYVSSRVGAHVLTDLVAVVDDAAELDPAGLPANFVLKAAHASGGVLLISDQAPAGGRLPDVETYWPSAAVRPEHVDWDELRALVAAWLDRLYGGGPRREWAYVDVPRRIIVEELLVDEAGGVPADYKLFVFNGSCRLIQLDSARFEGHRQDFFLPDWTWIDAHLVAPSSVTPPDAPASLPALIELSEALGADTDFVRVDLYDVGDRLVFGELTSYPQGGNWLFQPESFDETVGGWWDLPDRYEELPPPRG